MIHYVDGLVQWLLTTDNPTVASNRRAAIEHRIEQCEWAIAQPQDKRRWPYRGEVRRLKELRKALKSVK